MNDRESGPRQDVTISVERMMRFCYLAEMMFEHAPDEPKALPLHLTRFGTLMFETASFLYSLFEDKENAINLVKVWRDFDHPFSDELQNYVARLSPFKEELRFVRNRVGFHGSLNRSRERKGLAIFDIDSSRGRDFAHLVRDMQQLCLPMIGWYMKGLDSSLRPEEMWKEFVTEMQGSSRNQA